MRVIGNLIGMLSGAIVAIGMSVAFVTGVFAGWGLHNYDSSKKSSKIDYSNFYKDKTE